MTGQICDFLENVIGLEPFYQMGPFGSEEDDWMHDMLNVHPRAVIRRVRHYRCGHGPNIELFEYESPDQRQVMPKNSDWGGHHITLYVDDIDAAMDHLRAHGVRLMAGGGPPVPRRAAARRATISTSNTQPEMNGSAKSALQSGETRKSFAPHWVS